jgi:hypothetical protein
MARRIQQDRIPFQKHSMARLGAKLEKNLQAYAVAATAAGIGVALAAPPASAKIVYTPSNIIITQNGGLIPLDLNHDGKPDFEFSNYSYFTHGLGRAFLKVDPALASNEIWGVMSKDHLCAAALIRGKEVGPTGKFQKDPADGLYLADIGLGTTGSTAFGPWRNVETAYLGLKFTINGKTHFGWARVEFTTQGYFESARIAGYAYETIADKPIETGKMKGPEMIGLTTRPAQIEAVSTPAPACLGLLARGADTLEIWRRKE